MSVTQNKLTGCRARLSNVVVGKCDTAGEKKSGIEWKENERDVYREMRI